MALAFITFTAHAQQARYSLFDISKAQFNPASIADGTINGNALYRTQWMGNSVQLNSFALGFSYPFRLFKENGPLIAVGLSALSDNTRGDGSLKQVDYGGQLAVSFSAGKGNYLMLGAGLEKIDYRLDADRWRTGSQFVPWEGFSGDMPSLEPGENMGDATFSLGAGAEWLSVDPKGREKFRVGFSATNINNPSMEWSAENTYDYPMLFSFYGKARVLDKNRWQLSPTVLAQTQAGNLRFMGGVEARLSMNRRSKISGIMMRGAYISEFGPHYGLGVEMGPWQIWLAADQAMGERTPAIQSAGEVALVYRRVSEKVFFKLDKNKKSKKVKKKKKRKSKKKKYKKRRKSKKRYRKSRKRRNRGWFGRRRRRPKRRKKRTVTRAKTNRTVVKNTAKTMKKRTMPNRLPIIAREVDTNSLMINYRTEETLRTIMNNRKMTVRFSAVNSSAVTQKEREMIKSLLESHGNDYSNVVLIGHTDETGAKKYNEKLGLQRAEMVKQLLIEMGVNPEKIRLESKGESEPIFTEKNKQFLNRRVDIQFEK
ncbi:type IX secretion system membrane protein PorP/SprF [Fulvitalea axinellae]|uniref:type IX secretion system membrane protein PorP/SprF n=1 Tax=Fulvitalea axinellae TaxID=1182444 RepID=UPI0030CA2915